MIIDCIIVEDEPLARSRLEGYVDKVPFLNLRRSFDNGMEAIAFLGTTSVDLLFLDIQMDGFNGMQLLESVRNKPEVIITTAFDQYALKGYEFNVIDFLLKPYTFERFMVSVLKVRDKISNHLSETPEYVFIKTEHRLEKVFTNEILHVEGMRDYRQIHLIDRRIMTLETFKDLERLLPSRTFCRVHKSFMVSVAKIESIEKDRIKIGTALIPVSDTYKENFYKLIAPAARK